MTSRQYILSTTIKLKKGKWQNGSSVYYLLKFGL